MTDTTVTAGLSWIALAIDTASATVHRTSLTGTGSTQLDASARFQQATEFALPATATPVESSNGYIWLCGFATTA